MTEITNEFEAKQGFLNCHKVHPSIMYGSFKYHFPCEEAHNFHYKHPDKIRITNKSKDPNNNIFSQSFYYLAIESECIQ